MDGSEARMLTVADARAALAVGEDGTSVTFWTGEPEITITYGEKWFAGELTDPAPAWLLVPGGLRYQLTRQAACQLGSTAKANRRYQEFLPPANLSADVNFALREGLGQREVKLLLSESVSGTAEDGTEIPLAVAQTRAKVVPFSNLRLLDIAMLAARAELGSIVADSALVDYKFFNDWEHTSFRLVYPGERRLVDGAAWCPGIEVSNSLTGLKQTTVAGYLFRLDTTAGVPDLEHAAGGFNRRGSLPDDVYDWAAESSQDAFRHLDEAFDGLDALQQCEVDGDYVTVLTQLFHDSPVSKELKLRILDDLEHHEGELTMLDLMHAASQAANLLGATWREVRSLHDLAGHILHQGGGMCDGSLPRGCRRLLPDGWEAPAAS